MKAFISSLTDIRGGNCGLKVKQTCCHMQLCNNELKQLDHAVCSWEFKVVRPDNWNRKLQNTGWNTSVSFTLILRTALSWFYTSYFIHVQLTLLVKSHFSHLYRQTIYETKNTVESCLCGISKPAKVETYMFALLLQYFFLNRWRYYTFHSKCLFHILASCCGDAFNQQEKGG